MSQSNQLISPRAALAQVAAAMDAYTRILTPVQTTAQLTTLKAQVMSLLFSFLFGLSCEVQHVESI